MNSLLDRWDFDESTERLVMGMLAMGLRNVGQVTCGGRLQEIAFLNEAGVRVDINFRHMKGDQPCRLQPLTGVTD